MNGNDFVPRLNMNDYTPPSMQSNWQNDTMTQRLNQSMAEFEQSRANLLQAVQQQDAQMMANMRNASILSFPNMGM